MMRPARAATTAIAKALAPEHRGEVIRARDEFERQWRTVLMQGAAAGWRMGTVEINGILDMFNYTARWTSDSGALSPDEIADRYTSLLLDGLRAGPLDQETADA